MTWHFKALFVLAFGASQLSAALSQGGNTSNAPDPDRSLVDAKCTGCHLASIYATQPRSEAQWAEVIERMIAHGAQITDAEYPRILAYLARHYPPVSHANHGP
jgi:hypothetical protein